MIEKSGKFKGFDLKLMFYMGCKKGDLRMVKFLIDHESVNYCNDKSVRCNALLLASEFDNYNIFEFLIER